MVGKTQLLDLIYAFLVVFFFVISTQRKLNGLDDNLSQQPLMCVMLCTIHDSCPPQKKVEICPRSVMQVREFSLSKRWKTLSKENNS